MSEEDTPKNLERARSQRPTIRTMQELSKAGEKSQYFESWDLVILFLESQENQEGYIQREVTVLVQGDVVRLLGEQVEIINEKRVHSLLKEQATV